MYFVLIKAAFALLNFAARVIFLFLGLLDTHTAHKHVVITCEYRAPYVSSLGYAKVHERTYVCDYVHRPSS